MQLHPALSFCEVQGRYVFLDLDRDRYFCLGGATEAAWRALLAGLASQAQTERLAAEGLIVPGTSPAIASCPAHIAQTSLLGAPPPPPHSSLRILALGWGVVRARRQLRRNGLAAAVAALRRARGGPRPPGLGDRDALRAIAADFARLDLLTTVHNRCLPRSLALTAYLARCGYCAKLVIGVRLGPFRAHCWVECAGALVNERRERAAPYTPIRRL